MNKLKMQFNNGDKVDYLTAREVVKAGCFVVCREDISGRAYVDSWWTSYYYIKNGKLYREFVNPGKGLKSKSNYENIEEEISKHIFSKKDCIYEVYDHLLW